ncbi:MAG: hypothetical protein KDI11_04555 [Alphaproteobacteria bacterium]|nr:hypothetical protein [Alphaproteobacteria bacterium]
MAKKKAVRKGAGQKAKEKGVKRSGSAWMNLFLIVLILMAAVFLPVAVILFIGLLPTFVAFYADRNKKKIKPITVGAMNIAGCMPFIMELWTTDMSMSKALSVIMDPMAIIVIYSAAGIGYLIDWAVTMLVANFLYQRGRSRKNTIEKRQTELIARWGEEVSGRIPIDHEGFPIEDAVEEGT